MRASSFLRHADELLHIGALALNEGGAVGQADAHAEMADALTAAIETGLQDALMTAPPPSRIIPAAIRPGHPAKLGAYPGSRTFVDARQHQRPRPPGSPLRHPRPADPPPQIMPDALR